DYLYRRAWPGNVRELRNVVTRGVSVAEGPELELQDVMLEYVTAPEAAESSGSLSLAEAMKRHIAGALRLCRGDVNAAASLLDISRSALYRKIAEFGLDRHG
ncbi:MAG: sigma-54-dependent Fis family transcriptional regulator, partial [Candidatus Hydrogenedentes bacterium]|nr:sigma-54-dependent Fis family transcriptional regulator [Candidatus Hydrogenedentota bacterium]